MKKLALAAALAATAVPALAQSNDPFGEQKPAPQPEPSSIVRLDLNIADGEDETVGIQFWTWRDERATGLKLFLDYEILDDFKVSVIPAHGVFSLDTGVRWPTDGACTYNAKRITCELSAGPGAIFLDMDSTGAGSIMRTRGHSAAVFDATGTISPVKKPVKKK